MNRTSGTTAAGSKPAVYFVANTHINGMSHLEVRTPDGGSEMRKLSRRNPIVVGRNPISDIHVDEDGVAGIHCRVSWTGTSFEVAAVSAEGVDVNGTLVQRKRLDTGDVIRIGATDLVMMNGSGEIKRAPAAVAHVASLPDLDDAKAASDLDDDEWEVLSEGEIEFPVYEPGPEPPREAPSPPKPARTAPGQAAAVPPSDEPVLLEEPSPPASAAAPAKPKEPRLTPAPSRWAGLVKTKRPGEQDVLTSPLVLGFGGLALALLLAAGAIWLLIGREGADRLYATAVADREAGRYAQAIQSFEHFLLEYPTDSRAIEARFALGLTRVDRFARGAAPDYEKALKEFDAFVRDNRDADTFESQKEPLRNLARQIASGASAAAVRTGDRSLLAPATAARTLYDRYAPADRSADAVRAALAEEFAAAEAAVRRREYFDAAATKIENAIAGSDFDTAFQTRSDLLTRYPDLRSDRRVRALLTKSLAAERQLVQPVDVSRSTPPMSEQDEHDGSPSSLPPLIPVGHTQARAGEVSDGRIIFAVDRDSVYGLDAVTGRPIWRTPLGLDAPFFPMEAEASVPALLAFDASRNELLLLQRDDGQPIWRAAAGGRATGPPLIAQGQIDLTTDDGQLKRFELETGRLLAAVAFPQNVVGPAIRAGERLIVFGERATAYTLDFRSLAVEAVSFLGQADGALESPPQVLGRLVLCFENDRQNSALVRVFTVDDETGVLAQVTAERVDGHVRQPAVARGKVLFVPSSMERITAFSMSDDAGQPPLTRLAGVQIPDAKDVPTFLVPGPDGVLWAAGSALRKLRLTAGKVELLPGQLAAGRHTQPPQQSGESLFVARSLATAPAIYVSQANREEMTGSWRTVLGAGVAGAAVADGAMTIVTSAGQALTVSEASLEAGGFVDTRAIPQWNDDASAPLLGTMTHFADGLVWRDGSPPLSWRVRAGDVPGASRSLPAMPQCSPIRLTGGSVLPLPGRLEWLPDPSGAKVEAFLLPVSGDDASTPRWQSLVPLDGERLVATDEHGTMRLIRLRAEPLPHLDEEASITRDAPLSQPPAAVANRIAIADGDILRLLDPAGFRPVSETKTSGKITGGPWSEGASVFVETGERRVSAFDADGLKTMWTVDAGAPLAAAPVAIGTEWIIATQTGKVFSVSAAGEDKLRVEIRTPLSGLVVLGDQVVAIGLDGALHRIPLDSRSPAPADSEANPPVEAPDATPEAPK